MAAQCPSQWLPGAGVPGVQAGIPVLQGSVGALQVWDRDGAGPANPKLVVLGNFSLAGDLPATNIAAYDLITGVWTALGSGVPGASTGGNGRCAMAVLPNGDLVVGGTFTVAGGIAANRIARWNGVAWSALEGGVNGTVNDLGVMSNGDLIAVGSFSSAGGVPVTGVARWNGVSWSRFGDLLPTGAFISSVAILPNDDVVIAGDFFSPTYSGLAYGSGGAWQQVGCHSTLSSVCPGHYAGSGPTTQIEAMQNGDLLCGQILHDPNSGWEIKLARWSWALSSFGAVGPFPSSVEANGGTLRSIALFDQNNYAVLFDGGSSSSVPGVTMGGGVQLYRQSTNSWARIADPARFFCSAVLPGGDLVVGGAFRSVGVGSNQVSALNIARWNGSSWSALGTGFSSTVNASAVLPNGDLVVVGDFASAGAVSAYGVARWSASTDAWSPLGAGIGYINATSAGQGRVRAVAVAPNGDVIIGGRFVNTPEVPGPGNGVARWNGTSWSSLGAGVGSGWPDSGVFAVAVRPNGDVVAGGSFRTAGNVAVDCIARWDGTSWSSMSLTVPSGLRVSALTVLPNGDVVAGLTSKVSVTGGLAGIVRWNGVSWAPAGQGEPNYLDNTNTPFFPRLALRANGELLAAFASVSGGVDRFWRLVGSTWQPIPGGRPFAIDSLPNNDIVVLQPDTAGFSLSRWNGGAWSSMGGIDLWNGAQSTLAVMPSGQIVVGGMFRQINGQVSAFLGRYATPCVASVANLGMSCPSSSGSNTYAATTSPWAGSTFRTRGTGLPLFAFVASVSGFGTTSIPLSAILPPSPAGCTLLVSPDIVDITISNAGTVDAQVALPNTPSLAGTILHQQLIALEVDANLNFVQSTSTNALAATIGVF